MVRINILYYSKENIFRRKLGGFMNKGFMDKKKKIAVLVLVLLLGGSLAYILTNKSEESALTLYGNVDQRQVQPAFKYSERIAEILVEEGSMVEEGQILARLETRQLETDIVAAKAQVSIGEAGLARLENGPRQEEIDQAKAARSAANAEVVFSQAQYDRINSLWEKSKGLGISEKDVDEALLQLNVSRANLEYNSKVLKLLEIGARSEDIAEAKAHLLVAQQSLETLYNHLAEAELKSPTKAVVQSRLLEVGELASPQRPVFSLAIVSPKWIRAYITERNLGYINTGMEALIYTDSYPDEPIEGIVSFISSESEFTPKTIQTEDLRTSLVYEIRILVGDTENRLRLGMPVTVNFVQIDS